VVPECCSIKDLISALLIPSSLPVTKKVLSWSDLFFWFDIKFEIVRKLPSLLITSRFVLLEKKFLIEFIWVSPIPSIFNRSLYFFVLDSSLNFKKDPKYFAISFAFSKPICLIPRAYINFSSDIFFLSLIEYFKFSTDNLPHPSNFSILL